MHYLYDRAPIPSQDCWPSALLESVLRQAWGTKFCDENAVRPRHCPHTANLFPRVSLHRLYRQATKARIPPYRGEVSAASPIARQYIIAIQELGEPTFTPIQNYTLSISQASLASLPVY